MSLLFLLCNIRLSNIYCTSYIVTNSCHFMKYFILNLKYAIATFLRNAYSLSQDICIGQWIKSMLWDNAILRNEMNYFELEFHAVHCRDIICSQVTSQQL